MSSLVTESVIDHAGPVSDHTNLMRTEKHEKVLEKLATSDRVTIVVERPTDGKMRVSDFMQSRLSIAA